MHGCGRRPVGAASRVLQSRYLPDFGSAPIRVATEVIRCEPDASYRTAVCDSGAHAYVPWEIRYVRDGVEVSEWSSSQPGLPAHLRVPPCGGRIYAYRCVTSPGGTQYHPWVPGTTVFLETGVRASIVESDGPVPSPQVPDVYTYDSNVTYPGGSVSTVIDVANGVYNIERALVRNTAGSPITQTSIAGAGPATFGTTSLDISGGYLVVLNEAVTLGLTSGGAGTAEVVVALSRVRHGALTVGTIDNFT